MFSLLFEKEADIAGFNFLCSLRGCLHARRNLENKNEQTWKMKNIYMKVWNIWKMKEFHIYTTLSVQYLMDLFESLES